MADSKIETSSPITFNHFRYDIRKKRKDKKKKKRKRKKERKKKKIAIVVDFPSVFLTKCYDI